MKNAHKKRERESDGVRIQNTPLKFFSKFFDHELILV